MVPIIRRVIRQLIREGINVNVTLLFGLPRYRQVAEAYIIDVTQAEHVLKCLPTLGIGIDQVTQQLESEGVTKFKQPFDKLMQRCGERKNI